MKNLNSRGGVADNALRPNVGIDVAKQFLDICLKTEEFRLPNDASGWVLLIEKVRAAHVDIVVIEASGGYERNVVLALQEAGICVARVNPRQTRDFAKSMGELAKTDKLDARILRDFGDVVARHPKREKYITPASDAHRSELA